MSQLRLLSGRRQKGESAKAIQACNDFLRLGPGRTLSLLRERYHDTPQNPATRSLYTLQEWSKSYNWQERAAAYDARLEEEKNRRRREVMEAGLALDYERVVKLKKLADLIERQIYEEGEDGTLHNLWVPDVKQVGSGEYAERVDIERYNSSIISDFRGLLDDLAKETGGRVHKTENKNTNENMLSLSAGAERALQLVYGNRDGDVVDVKVERLEGE